MRSLDSRDCQNNKIFSIGFDAKRLFYNKTGLGNYARNLVQSLHKYYPHIQIHLFTPSIVENEITKPFLNGDYIIHSCPMFIPAALWRTYFISFTINKLSLDVFHGLSQEIPFGINAKTKTIVTIHDLIADIFPHLFKWHDAWFYRKKFRSAALRANSIIAISESTKSDIVKYYHIDSEKIKVCYQTCDAIFQESSSKEYIRNHFLYVGSIIERKGLLDIVEAYHLSKVDLPSCIVIGEGHQYKLKVLNKLKEYGLNKKFQFLGTIENKALIEYYCKAKALILPSVYEGFGIPIIEAQFCNCPVICYNNSSLPEAAGANAFMIETKDFQKLSDAMTTLSNDFTYSDTTNDYVKKMFSEKVTIDRYVENILS